MASKVTEAAPESSPKIVTVRISSELGNVLLDPLEDHDLVEHPLVAAGRLVGGAEEAERPQPVVEGDKNNILLQEIAGPEEEAGPASHDVGPAMEVDQPPSSWSPTWGSTRSG